MTQILNNSSTNYKTLIENQSTDTSATFSGPPSSSISSSRVLGGRSSDNLSKRSRSSLFMIWALSTASWLVTELSWLSAFTAQKATTLPPHLRTHSCILVEAISPGAGVLGGLTGAVKEGLVELRPEASKALWIESGSMLFRLFFFFSFPFLGSFLMSQGSGRRKEKPCCSNTTTWIIFNSQLLPPSSSSSDSSLNGLKSSSSSAELTDLKLSSLSDSLSESSDSSELVPERPPCLRDFFFCCFLTSVADGVRNKERGLV